MVHLNEGQSVLMRVQWAQAVVAGLPHVEAALPIEKAPDGLDADGRCWGFPKQSGSDRMHPIGLD